MKNIMMDSLLHHWQYVPSIRGCSLFEHTVCVTYKEVFTVWQVTVGIMYKEGLVVSQATVCVFWADDATAPCKEWDVDQLGYFMDSVTDEAEYDAIANDSQLPPSCQSCRLFSTTVILCMAPLIFRNIC
jgi:hypothetical protein